MFTGKRYNRDAIKEVTSKGRDVYPSDTKTKCEKIYQSSRFNDKNAFRKWKIYISRFQLYARTYVRIWTLRPCIYVSLKRGKFDIRGNPAYCMDHYTVTVGYCCFSAPAWLSKNIIRANFISINISWWLYSNILLLFPLNNIANIKI